MPLTYEAVRRKKRLYEANRKAFGNSNQVMARNVANQINLRQVTILKQIAGTTKNTGTEESQKYDL